MATFDHHHIEQKWQKKWEDAQMYKTADTVEGKENRYMLVEFPYPSGNLHIGHWYAFAVPDIYARFLRMQGHNVLFPIGFDSFGLPAENAAIKRGLDPRAWTYGNIDFMSSQLRSMGNSFDWSRKVVASDPEYYKWTQWLFLQLYNKGLAYKKKSSVPWCDSCKTVLANEQIVAGRCERCGTEVVQKELDQWFFKITDYAERLLGDLDDLEWPEEIKAAQREWIGKSAGALLQFQVLSTKYGVPTADDSELRTQNSQTIEVFTTRPDTLYGVTYVVLAPEHELVAELLANNELGITNKEEVRTYVEQTKNKKELERKEAKEKTGVELNGVKAINPATNEEIPVWIADYVLASYGTGAVMAVPAHDERDYEFAKKYDLPIRQVVIPCADDSINPPKKGFTEVKRDTVIVHLKDKETGKYALLDWHGSLEGITTAIMGGIESHQTPEQAVLAEIMEEAALTAVTITKKLSWITAARYCASHKGENRCAVAHTFLAEVEHIHDQGVIDESEKKLHTLVWVDENEVLRRLTPDHQKQVWQLLCEEIALPGNGILMDSGPFTDLSNEEVKQKITEHVGGTMTTQYRLRDWLLSRQRYWGCPIPIVYDPVGKPHVVPDEHLPWMLPTDVDFTPTGEAPLARSSELKERTERIFGKGWTPEVDTMDTFVDSSWYFLRYLDPHNDKEFSPIEKQKQWMPVDRYSGGAEHTTMHLLYSRFFHKALFDLGLTTCAEPYQKRMSRGLILGPDGHKMSKSKGNVIDPDEHVVRVGADTVKTYLAFIGPYNEVGQYPWDLGGIAGVRRFLERIWSMKERVTSSKYEVLSNDEATNTQNSELSTQSLLLLHQTVKKVGEDIGAFKFNTAISQLMILVNALEKASVVPVSVYEPLIRMLAPFAPHLAEEIWEALGHTTSVHLEPWPTYDERVLSGASVTIAVQINGKMRATFTASPGLSKAEMINTAKAVPSVAERLNGATIMREVYVPGRLVNLVVE
jgi:leucyl-tRNA synthetase